VLADLDGVAMRYTLLALILCCAFWYGCVYAADGLAYWVQWISM
jgi:hypothetical protein